MLEIAPLFYNSEVYSSSGLKLYSNNVYDGCRVSIDGHSTMLTRCELVALREAIGKL